MTGVKLALTSKETRERLGIGRTAFYLLRQKDPTFPKPIKALSSARKLVFSASEVAQWIKANERG